MRWDSIAVVTCGHYFFRTLLFVCLLGGMASPAAAQHYFCVEHGGKMKVVHKIENRFSFVKEDGQLKAVPSTRGALSPAPDYLPIFIAVRSVQVSTSALSRAGGGSFNNEFHFTAQFESAYALKDVFYVLALDLKRGGERIYWQGVGNLTPRRPQNIDVLIPLQEELGPGRFHLYVFVQGLEVFHSEQPFAYREMMLTKMVQDRIAGLRDAPPRPFIGPTPEYPKNLRNAGTKGEVVLKMKITATGGVVDPEVESATDPAFGEAAVVALQQWRFLPQVKDGQPVATSVSMPFSFEPPAEEKKR